MKQARREAVKISMPVLSPKAAYTLSNWLFGLAQETDLYYADEIRSHMQRLDNERERKLDKEYTERLDDDIDF